MTTTIEPAKLGTFMGVYAESLRRAVLEYPLDYTWPVEQVPTVAARMEAAIIRGSFNHDGHGFKGACKAVGIKHTRKAIIAYLSA